MSVVVYCLVFFSFALSLIARAVYTWPIFTNPASQDAGVPGRTRRTCFVASVLELAAVAVVLWFWWCVLNAAGCRGGVRCFLHRTHTAYGLCHSLASFASLLVLREGRVSEATEAVFLLLDKKKPLRCEVRTGCYYLISLSSLLCLSCLSVRVCCLIVWSTA